MKKALVIVCLLLGISFEMYAQTENNSLAVHFSDLTWYDKGFDFYIAGGAFFGNKFNATYYNGSQRNENSLDIIFGNQYRYEELQQMVTNAYPHISTSDKIYVNDPDDLDWNLNYKLGLMVSLGVRYKIGNGWGLALSYSFSRIKTSTHVLISSNAVTGNLYKQPVLALVGKEYRSMIDFSASYLFSKVHRTIKPFLELGVQFNYAKAKSFEAALLDKDGRQAGGYDANGNEIPAPTFSLLNIYDNQGYYPGAQTYDYIFGGPGFGFSGSAGLKIVCGKNVSIDPTFYASFGRIGIYQGKNVGGENRFTFNYGVMVRVVMNDFFVSER
ncbi:MAG: hypothetical protein K5636_01510 [Bacteroidales bacterium]|nr:hypothetical protein [Bacteroidales bacterium]